MPTPKKTYWGLTAHQLKARRFCAACGELKVHDAYTTNRVIRCRPCAQANHPVKDEYKRLERKRQNVIKTNKERADSVKNAQKANVKKAKDKKNWAISADKREDIHSADNTNTVLQQKRAKNTLRPVPGKTASANVVQRELANRQLAKRKLIYFILRTFPEYEAGWVHNLICTKLEKFSADVIAKKAPRLMIFVPPRHGKSEIASKNFPAWHLGHAPHHEIIAASYGVSLPMGFSRKIKEMIKTPAYQGVFPKTLMHPDAQATEGWLTTKGGGYVPAGVGGSITGKGAHVLIIDDPVKDADEADSETIRERNWDWYGSTARTRLAPGGGILVIQTRWHDDDLSGKLIHQMTEDLREIEEELQEAREAGADEKTLARIEAKKDEVEQWEIINLPALAEQEEYFDPVSGKIVHSRDNDSCRFLRHQGDALHPARFDELSLRKMRRTMAKRHWSALMQQNPVPDDGDIFTKDSFRMMPVRPRLSNHHVYIAWDLAIGQKQQNDWTVGLVGALDENGFLIIYDMIRVKTNELAKLIFDTSLLYRHNLQQMGLERGQIQMSIMPSLERLFDDNSKANGGFYPSFNEDLKPITDKVARARVAQGMAQHGKILLPQDQPWVETFLAELLRFPNGLHDDIVDALSWLCRMVEGVAPPQPKRPEPKIDSWKDKLRRQQLGLRTGGAMSA